jgi:hypothetical protein
LFEKLYNQLRRVFYEHRVGICSTISIHLVAIIVFLLYSINSLRSDEAFFAIDFSKQEEKVALEEKEQRVKSFEKELNQVLSGNMRSHELRNVAVDKSENILRDDRHQNPSVIYDEAKEVQARLDASRNAARQQQGGDYVPVTAKPDNNSGKAETYKGPSVLSYDLGGRKAMRLPIPVYKCQGGGDVTVMIEVDRRGNVVSMLISTTASVDNTCLHEAAKKAASTSRFAANANAPERQKGHITYRFIAQ